MGWNILNSELGEYIDAIPAQQRIGESWYLGTADSIYQNLYLVNEEKPDDVVILAGDHIYKMDYARMIEFHRQRDADLTVAVVEAQVQQAQRLGILEIDRNLRVRGFQEKPPRPKTFFGRVNAIYASMGIYIFKRQILIEELENDAQTKESAHDFGKDIIPQMTKEQKRIFAYNFKDSRTNKAKYWRDVGDIDAFYEANMDLVKVTPEFNLYDKNWPIRTYQEQFPPAKTVWGGEENKARVGQPINSLVANGCIISGGLVKYSILSPAVRINSFSEVYDSIIMEGSVVGRYAKIKRAIIDKDVTISEGAQIGYNLTEDRQRFTVTDSEIVVVPKGSVV